MAKYTTELRTICEYYAGYVESQDYDRIDDVISKALNKVFDFDFPIFDENYRSVLETKIIKHYYTREIGAETVARWKLFLNDRMNMIMPYYNKLYESELLTFNPLNDIDLTTDHTNNNKGESAINNTSHSDSSNTGESWNYHHDTPQGGISGLDSLNYLTDATKDTDKSNSSNNGSTSGKQNFTNTEDYLEHIKGKTASKSYSELLREYRKTFLNIDMQIVNNLEDLFMNIW